MKASTDLFLQGSEQDEGGEAEGAGKEDEVLRQGAPGDARVRFSLQGTRIHSSVSLFIH